MSVSSIQGGAPSTIVVPERTHENRAVLIALANEVLEPERCSDLKELSRVVELLKPELQAMRASGYDKIIQLFSRFSANSSALMSPEFRLIAELQPLLSSRSLRRIANDMLRPGETLQRAISESFLAGAESGVIIKKTIEVFGKRAVLSLLATYPHHVLLDSIEQRRPLDYIQALLTIYDDPQEWAELLSSRNTSPLFSAVQYGKAEISIALMEHCQRLCPEILYKALDPTQSDHFLLAKAVLRKKLTVTQAIGQILFKDKPDILRCCFSYRDVTGNLFHYAGLSRDLPTIRYIFELADQLDPKLRSVATESRDDGVTMVHLCALPTRLVVRSSTDGSICLTLREIMGDKAMGQAATGSQLTAFEYALTHSQYDARLLDLLFSYLSPEAQKATLAKIRAERPTFLGGIAGQLSLDSYHYLSKLLLDDKDLSMAKGRDVSGYSGLHYAARGGNTPVLRRLIEQLRSQGEEVLRAAAMPTNEGKSLLMLAITEGNLSALEIVAELCESLGPDFVRQSLLADRDDICIFTACSLHTPPFAILARLLPYLETDRQVRNAFGSKRFWGLLKYDHVTDFLMGRYPIPEDRQHLALYIAMKHQTFRPTSERLAVLYGEAPSHPAMPLIYSTRHFPALYPALLTSIQASHDQLNRKAGVLIHADPEVVRRMDHLSQWKRDIHLALTVSKADDSYVTRQLRTFERLKNLANPELRTQLTQLIADIQLGNPATVAQLDRWLPEPPSSKQPCLYIFPLMQLCLMGATPEKVDRLAACIQETSRTAFEGRPSGRFLLSALLSLCAQDQLTPADLDLLLDRITATADLMASIAAIEQMIRLKYTHCLRADFLSQTDKLLPAIAEDCFQDFFGLRAFEGFQAKYTRAIASQRDHKDLVTYASGISGYPETKADLSSCLGAILDGQFQLWRYAEGRSPHLDALYAAAPRLKAQLPELSRSLPAAPVGGASSSTQSFPFGREQIADKILEDKLLSEEHYPFIYLYLERNLDLDTALLVEPPDHEAAQRLRLQRCLIDICDSSDFAEQTDLLKEAIETASDLPSAQALRRAMQEAMESMVRSESSSADSLQVTVSDHYWDLFRVGTDVTGSCQSLLGRPHLCRHLLGYVMNGHVLPIVVKKAGDDKIQARRLLMVYLDVNTGAPALYLERKYANLHQQEIDGAIVAMAKRVADELQLPLYSKTVPGTAAGIMLHAQSHAAATIYSDAVGGGQTSPYRFHPGFLIHQPASSGSAAASSSSAVG